MKLHIEIEDGNAAFAAEPASEFARILSDLARRFREDGGLPPKGINMRDSNGNICGFARITRTRK